MNDKILIVDDQLGIRILLKEILQKEGYQIFQASNGHQALAITKEISPDLVLLDMKIPGMDGLEILERMKNLNENIKVIIMTAYGDQKMMDRSKRLGALTHFPKPFDIEELRSTVKKYMPSKVDT